MYSIIVYFKKKRGILVQRIYVFKIKKRNLRFFFFTVKTKKESKVRLTR